MGSSTHGEHLTQITRFGALNAYLVREDDGFTLVDTLIRGSAGRLMAAAAGVGAPIRRIVLTHAHADHIGSLDALVAELPGVEVLAGAREARLMAGDLAPEPGEAPVRSAAFPRVRVRPTSTLVPGDRVGSLTVYAAPGHSPGQIALLDERDGTLIAGDATLGGVATSGHPRLPFPFPALASWHRPTALASARSLRDLAPRRLATGHGPVVTSPGDAMDRALAAASA